MACRLLYLLFAAILAAQPLFGQTAKYEPVPRRTINSAIVGVNAFVNDRRFGSVKSQLIEVRQKLRLKYVRVLFNWNDQIQPSPSATPFFGFYDDIARNIPRGVTALVIVNGLPSWMKDKRNWIDGDPRKTFVELWLKKVVQRYKGRTRLTAYQIWNEPNDDGKTDNTVLGFVDHPENYVSMLAQAYTTVKSIAPRTVVGAATTAINQNFPDTLNYNQALQDAGMEQHLDVWAFHYYGTSYERLLLLTDTPDFLNTIKKPLWLTESGQRGTSKQLAYAERLWPLLIELVPSIKRTYWYQFTDTSPAKSSYGLRTLTPGSYQSDLYRYLNTR